MIRKSVFFISLSYFTICYYSVVFLFLLPLPLGSRNNVEHYIPFMLRNLPWLIITTISVNIQLYNSFDNNYLVIALISIFAVTFYLLIQLIKNKYDQAN